AFSPFKWEFRLAEVESLVEELPRLSSDGWQETTLGENAFAGAGKRRFGLFRAEIGHPADGAKRTLVFDSVDDNAVVFLNGKRLHRHIGFGIPFRVPVAAAWNPKGPNDLVVLVENTAAGGGINGGVRFEIPRAESTPKQALPAFDDRRWRAVHLPHDYVVEGKFDPRGDVSHGTQPKPIGWYRKTFTLPASAEGKAIWLDFDGAYRNATVYLNGEKLGTESSGYIGFRHDISLRVKFGKPNTLAVVTDPRQNEGWWYEGGGLYRHVWLNLADPIAIVPDSVSVRTEIAGPESAPTEATVIVGADFGGRDGGPVRLVQRVIAPDGAPPGVAGQDAFPDVPDNHWAWTNRTKQRIVIARPQLWSVEHPNLYRLETTLYKKGELVDRVNMKFGIRSMRWDKDAGFFLNGKRTMLKGTCNHQDHAGVGVAIPDRLFEWRIKKLKAMGSNAYRCSHNPPATELLDACDRLGMLVLDETRHLGDATTAKSPTGTPYKELSELTRMVLRDRNHPSIIAWSLFNEEPLQGTDEGARIFQAMEKRVKEIDPTREVTGAMNFGFNAGIQKVSRVFGFNYSLWAYDDVRKKDPGLALFGSETASAVSTRGIYANDKERGYVSAYDVNHPEWGATAEKAWKEVVKRPYMAGAFVWTGFDYKGEPTPYGWPCINSHFGILDICGFPKDTFWYYKSWWGDQPVVYLLPHWNWPGKEGETINVWAHSNADTVELFLNGRSLGTKTMERLGHLEWDVPYEPGKLEARGYRNGAVIASDVVETAGAPASVRLKTDVRRLMADHEDVALVEVEILDAQGRVAPTADNPVRFSVVGPGAIAGVGNGDPSSHEPDKASQRKAFNGRCMALVQTTNQTGKIVLRAESPGLKGASVEFATVPSKNR
ncbi:DUF4982 domain-containing protein, partial [bacterium]